MTDAPRPATPLHRLRLLGLVGPLAFVSILLILRPMMVEVYGLAATHVFLGTLLFVSAALFGWAMFRLLERAHSAVVEAERQTAALVERDRIARELHDSLAQVLGVAHLRLRALESRPSVANDERVRADIDDLATLCREAHRDVREAIVGLKDAPRERTLVENLDAYVSVFSRTSGIPTSLATDVDHGLGLTAAAEVQVVRVVQEALTNIRKHAGARCASVRVTARGDHAEFVVEDDGVGFNPTLPTQPDGFGLTTMRERTESVGGQLVVESSPGRGTRVVALLPAAGAST